MHAAAAATLRAFLRDLSRRLSPADLTAAAEPRAVALFTLGEAAGWWDQAVDQQLAADVRATWRAGWVDTTDLPAGAATDASAEYLAAVKDRLSRTAQPTIPEQAFDRARLALADELAQGHSIREASRRLAAEFSWDQPAEFWRGRLAAVDGRIDAILDPIGPPGAPAREAARLNDPAVRALQDRRADAARRIDRVQSEWQTRAERIGRTEATGAYNAGALEAGVVEEAGVKRWLATADGRTRASHLAADGQCVPVQDTFTVGGASMQMPGDPSAPAGEVIQCRCSIVFARDCDDADERYGPVTAVVDAERDRRAEDRAAGAPPP